MANNQCATNSQVLNHEEAFCCSIGNYALQAIIILAVAVVAVFVMQGKWQAAASDFNDKFLLSS